ncbi:conjugal transfer protein TraG [Bacteroidia bacterium]|nr:conjugal transfer protein TraG [Bacteroidia bacterium]
MPKSKDSKELIYIGIGGAFIGCCITLLELYYNNYQLIARLHLNISIFDSYLASHPFWDFLQNNIWVRLIVIGAWAAMLFFPTAAEKKGSAYPYILKLILYCAVFYFLRWLNIILPATPAQIINILGSLFLIIPIIRKFVFLSRYLSLVDTGLDNDKNADGFEQTEELITNEYSVNLKYLFTYKGQTRTGYANFVNPFRGTITLGTPGSGKTYVSLEEFIRQFIQKGYAAVIYDYKDPALSALAYSYLRDYQISKGDQKPKWGYISFKDLNRTYRSNPMKGIVTNEDANDFAEVLLLALNHNMAEKQGDFFGESAKNYTALAIFVLGVLFEGKYQSLPHILTLIGSPIEDLFPIYALLSVFYPSLQSISNTFIEAFNQGAIEQVQGQVASARIGLARINNPLLCYVMTEDEEHPEENISLEVNNKENPTVLCIGNDPQKDIILGLANSVYLSRLAKVVNKKGHPTLFGIDELPTVFIKGLDTLIATARSNKVAVSLGFQDFTQLVRDYGEKIAKAIINTCGNLISGSVKGQTAKDLSDSFGEKKFNKKGKTVSSEGDVSFNINEQKEKKIPQDVIEELSQGTFVGRTMDEMDKSINFKVFHGKFIIDPEWKKIKHDIPTLRNLTERDQSEITQRAQIKVKNDIQLFLNEVGAVAKQYATLFKEYTMPVVKKKNETPQLICLDRFVGNPEDPELQKQFVVWLEAAYIVVGDFKALYLVNDYLNDEDKFDLLLTNVYKTSMDKVQVVKDERKKLNLMDLESVQKRIKDEGIDLSGSQGDENDAV